MTVGAGDSLYYDSNELHGYVAIGDIPARAVAVIYSVD
jgi:quercetin dioxygenase-like cupin family protein